MKRLESGIAIALFFIFVVIATSIHKNKYGVHIAAPPQSNQAQQTAPSQPTAIAYPINKKITITKDRPVEIKLEPWEDMEGDVIESDVSVDEWVNSQESGSYYHMPSKLSGLNRTVAIKEVLVTNLIIQISPDSSSSNGTYWYTIKHK